MTESKVLPTTEFTIETNYRRTPGRLLWEKQKAEARASRLQVIFQEILWKPLETELGNKRHRDRLQCQCVCGTIGSVLISTIINRDTYGCRSCAARAKNAATTPERRVEIATLASKAATEALRQRIDPYAEKYGGKELDVVLSTLSAAKNRCNNPNDLAYINYGLRGIRFEFPSLRAAAEWVLDNLGPKPSGRSLDRIDNSKGYTPGNLRWATVSEQARNKRQYKRTPNGERIRKIMGARKDLAYETIRLWIAMGRTDEDILNRTKYDR